MNEGIGRRSPDTPQPALEARGTGVRAVGREAAQKEEYAKEYARQAARVAKAEEADEDLRRFLDAALEEVEDWT